MPGDSRPSAQPASALRSTLAADADMSELIEFFVSELGRTCASLRCAVDAQNIVDLRRLCHQLKGAAGGYGFPSISDAAAEAESTALSDECDLNMLRERVESLISLCHRAAS